MDAVLIYNSNSGGIDGATPEELQEALHRAGYDPVYRATKNEQDLDEILTGLNEGLVVAAGGDGTVHAVGKRLINRGVPLSILPLGTANNIARALGVEGDPTEIIAGLKKPRKRYFDMGRAKFPWGEEYFLEAMGFGFYADTLATYEPEQGKSILRGATAVAETLAQQRAYDCPMKLDSRDITGNYVMVEVLNTPSFGPWLTMAPGADLEDGLLELICIRADNRDGFLDYLTALLSNEIEELPSVSRECGRQLEITWMGFAFHVDGLVRPERIKELIDDQPDPTTPPPTLDTEEGKVVVDIVPRALEFWLPELDED
jgi:diacylglycerol kinase family enzyme